MLKRRLHWFQRQMRLSSAPAVLDELEAVVAAVDGAGVLPLEEVVGLCDCSLALLSWLEDILAGSSRQGLLTAGLLSCRVPSWVASRSTGSIQTSTEWSSWRLIGQEDGAFRKRERPD